MRLSTRFWIGGALLLTGLSVATLAMLGGGSDVRQVADVLAAPGAHVRGSYTLVGVPEPAQVPVSAGMAPNPDATNETTTVAVWARGTTTYHSALHLHAESCGVTCTRFTFTNATRVAGRDALAWPAATTNWTVQGHVFPVRGFQSGSTVPPTIWAVYTGAVKDPLQPKPSQFTGRLATAAPDGTPLPPGAYVFQVDSYVAGCSSKFIPPEEQQRLKAEGN